MKRSEIVSALRKFREMNTLRYGIIRMGLFGSAARDDMHEKSDIDVVVELEEPDMFNLVGIKQDLEDQLRLSVDVVRYRGRMNEFLKRRIDEEAVYV